MISFPQSDNGRFCCLYDPISKNLSVAIIFFAASSENIAIKIIPWRNTYGTKGDKTISYIPYRF